MSFSASTCLSYTGSLTLSPTLTVYSNPISSTNPGTFVTTVSSSDITGGNCPYTLIVPDGTTVIRLLDNVNFCYTDIPVSDNDLCITCDIEFNTVITTTIGKISVGDIISSCDSTITDYKISWYRSTDPLNPSFTSGKGTLFAPYNYVHPLTGTSEVPVISGSYSPQLDYIELNGVKFSRSGDTGTVLADLDCLPPSIVVEALNCVNGDGSSDLPQYEHKFNYNATTGGGTPEPLYSTFELSADTNYFAWRFKGFGVPDKLKLTLSGSAYNVPIVLDYWEIGGNASQNAQPNVMPKSVNTSDFFGKVIPLSAFTINNGDNIIMEVTPSSTNPQTSWTFYCTCLETFDCEPCLPPTATTVNGNISYQYPIILSSVGVTSDTCGVRFSYTVDATSCPYSTFSQSSYFLYAGAYSRYWGSSDYIVRNNIGPLYYNQLTCSLSDIHYINNPSCNNLGNGNIITYEKSTGLFRVTSNQLSIIDTYFYQPYLTEVVPYKSYPNDNTQYDYYRYFLLFYPNSTGTTPCGDGTIYKSLFIHQSSVVTTGQTGSDYYIQFTMPLITKGITFNNCNINCDNIVTGIISNINNSVSQSNYTGTTTVGSVFNNTIKSVSGLYTQTTSLTVLNEPINETLSYYYNYTFPFSGDPLTIIPSLSAETCPNISEYFSSLSVYSTSNSRYPSYYIFKIFDPTNLQNFRIYSKTNLKNSLTTSEETLIYEYSGGTVTYINNDYFV